MLAQVLCEPSESVLRLPEVEKSFVTSVSPTHAPQAPPVHTREPSEQNVYVPS